jgi:RNA polymerase sigma-70 factor (ECF subfamily)
MEQLVDASYNDVQRMCASLVDEESAGDLAQQAFLLIIKNLAQFQGRSSARTWILSIAHHVCMDELRSRSRARGHAERAEVAAGVHGNEPAAGDALIVTDLLGRLCPDRRSAFVLTQIYGFSYAEVAEMVGCAPGTVASRVARARDDLVAALVASERRVPDARLQLSQSRLV